MAPLPSFRPAATWGELLSAAMRGLGRRGRRDDFEGALAGYLGVRHALPAPSARWGLCQALLGLGLKPGDEVIVPAFTYFAVPAAVVRAGLRPVFVDIVPDGLVLDPDLIAASVTSRTRAIIPTHLSGFACAMDAVCAAARRHGLAVIEDCAQSLGGAFAGRRLGAWGRAAYFTFGVTKHVTTLGGAMVVTDDDALAGRLRRALPARPPAFPLAPFAMAALMKCATSAAGFPATWALLRLCALAGFDVVDRLFGEPARTLEGPPPPAGLHPAQAALGVLQLGALERRNERRRERALRLCERIGDLPGIRLPRPRARAWDVYATFPVFARDKARVRRELLRRGVDSSPGYMDDCSGLALFGESRRECPRAARAKREVLYLPFYEDLGEAQAARVALCLREAAGAA